MKFGQTLVSVFRLVDVIDTIAVWGEGIRHLQEAFRDGEGERRILIVLFDNLSVFREFGIEDDAVSGRRTPQESHRTGRGYHRSK